MAIRTPPVYANRPWLWLSTDDVRLYEWLRGIACRVRHSSRSRRHVERSVDFGCRTPWPCRRSQRFSGCRIRTLTRDNRSGARGAKRQRYRSEPMSRREIRGGDVPGGTAGFRLGGFLAEGIQRLLQITADGLVLLHWREDATAVLHHALTPIGYEPQTRRRRTGRGVPVCRGCLRRVRPPYGG